MSDDPNSRLLRQIESDLASVRADELRQRRKHWLRIGLGLFGVLCAAGIWLGGMIAQARESARMSNCKCGLKQLGLAFHNYHDTHGTFPPAIVLGPDGSPWHSWRVLILPFLECQAVYRKYRFDEPWDGPSNRKLLAEMPEIYACPSRPTPARAGLFSLCHHAMLGCGVRHLAGHRGFTSFSVPLDRSSMFPGIQAVKIGDVSDGTSNTILVAECTRTQIPWTKPEDVRIEQHPCFGDPNGFSGPHQGGVMALFADGTVKFLKLDLPQSTVGAIYTRNGGELLNNDF